MTVRKTASKAIAGLIVAIVATMACAAVAFAAPVVQGADFHATGSALQEHEVDVMTVAGATSEEVFVSVTAGDQTIARYIPYKLGEGSNVKGSGDNWTGIVSLDISTLDLDRLDGTYKVAAYDKPRAATPIYEGAIYGVYADLPDGSEVLIGTRTVGATDNPDRSFQPDETLYVGGVTYRLAGEAKGQGALHFPYQKYDESTTVDGVIRYVDQSGKVVATTKIAGLASDEEREVEIPSAIKGDDDNLYRTVFFKNAVTARNPGATSFTITCVKMSKEEMDAANFHVATILMVDENNRVIASDSVNVTGTFRYTAPSTIYKTAAVEGGSGEVGVYTYNIEESPYVTLSLNDPAVVNNSRTVVFKYKTTPPDPAEATVTYVLQDGSKRVGEQGRTLKTVTKHVDASNPECIPDATVEVGGTKYNLAGNPDDYKYALGTRAMPVINAYYMPEGYQTPDKPYDVTVKYVNFVTGEEIGSQAYTSQPDTKMTLESPATFEANGNTYIRLDGQDSIEHSFYSGIKEYVVYYRDQNDTLTSGTVINTIRVVYADEEGEGTTEGTATGTEDTATGTDESGAAAGTEGTTGGSDAAAIAEGISDLRLNDGRTYNVFDGEGNNSSLTNESGIDSNTERIEDDYNPLAAGLEEGSANGNGNTALWAVPIGVGVALVLIAIIAFVAIRSSRRKKNHF